MGWECTRRQEKPFKAIKTKKQGGLSAKPLNAINQAASYQAEKVRTSFFSPVPECPAFPFQKLIVPETVKRFLAQKYLEYAWTHNDENIHCYNQGWTRAVGLIRA